MKGADVISIPRDAPLGCVVRKRGIERTHPIEFLGSTRLRDYIGIYCVAPYSAHAQLSFASDALLFSCKHAGGGICNVPEWITARYP